MISRLDLTAVENTGSTVKLVFNGHLPLKQSEDDSTRKVTNRMLVSTDP